VKIGIISDIHFHLWRYGATVNAYGINSRLWDQWAVLRQFIKYCEDNDIGHVVITGDVFHTHNNVPTQVLYVVNEVLSEFPGDMDITVIAGNHDLESKNSRISSLSWMRRRVRLITSFGRWTADGVKFLGIGYTNDKHHLQSCLSEASGRIAFVHQGVAGESLGNGFVLKDEVLHPSMIPDDVVHCFAGHYHDRKFVTPKLTIVGAAMQHTRGDAGTDRGWIVYDTDTGNITPVLSVHPRFIDLNFHGTSTPLADLPKSYLEDLPKSYLEGNFVRAVNFVGDASKLYDYIVRDKKARVLEIQPQAMEERQKIDEEVKGLTAIDAVNKVKDGLDSRRQAVAVEIVENTYEVAEPENK